MIWIEEDCYYIGLSVEQVPQHLGVFVFQDGKTHIGEYNRGVLEGLGIIDFENGDRFRGSIHQGEFSSLGYMYNHRQQGYYLGEFTKGKCVTNLALGQYQSALATPVVSHYLDQKALTHLSQA